MQCFLDGAYYKAHKDDLTTEDVCHIFGMSTSGYYSWYNRITNKEARQIKASGEAELKKKVIEIVTVMGYVPGKRTLKTQLERRFDVHLSVKKCRKLLAEMHLVPNKPKKDPYKHQATHDHECAAPENRVNRNFYIAPRKVILTDITYLSYRNNQRVAYLCVFRDAFTKELLGWSVSHYMTVDDLIRPAYDMMMKEHGTELKSPDTFIHSDQGSQYLSASFQQMLEDDNFIQSVSGRGNSWDNSPMESFFGRMKTNIMDVIALAPDFETLRDLVNGYLIQYNEKDFQYDLAGLTPVEFYTYVTTGVYPCETYFGVDGSRLESPKALLEERRKKAEKNAEKARKRAKEKKQAGLSYEGKDPEKVIQRDIRILEREQKKWEESKQTAEKQCEFVGKVLARAEAALQFVKNASLEIKEALLDRTKWKTYPQLGYIFDMRGMF